MVAEENSPTKTLIYLFTFCICFVIVIMSFYLYNFFEHFQSKEYHYRKIPSFMIRNI